MTNLFASRNCVIMTLVLYLSTPAFFMLPPLCSYCHGYDDYCATDPYHFYLYGNQPENRTCYTMVQSNGETRWVTREICLKGICERLARQDIEYLVYCSECDTDLCNREDLYRIVPNIVEVPINAVCLGRGTNVALLLITCVVGILLGVLPLNQGSIQPPQLYTYVLVRDAS